MSLITKAAAVASVLAGVAMNLNSAEIRNAAEILQDLRGFREMGSVLHVAAHPDDENTQLLTYFSRGRHFRTAYLSVTRGDGGQNLLGPEFGEQLGIARTEELLAARRLDGARQFFTRALDFGFSKDYKETLQVWDHQQVLSDIVRIIRSFRPDIIVTRFSPQPSGTHGHHTASAYLALEAFKLAGDPTAFPEQLKDLTVWRPKRILMNGGGGGRGGGGGGAGANPNGLRVDVSGNDPVSGESFASIAGRSRSMHKTQGFGNFGGGGGGGGGPRFESFQLLDGDPASKDILEGIDTTWTRIPNGGEIGNLADEIISKFDTNQPAVSVPALLALRKRLSTVAADPIVDEKKRLLDQIVAGCLGLSVDTQTALPEVVPGEKLKLDHRVTLRSNIPVKWKDVRFPANNGRLNVNSALQNGQPVTKQSTPLLPAKTPLTQPYWLKEETTAGMFQVNDARLIGRPENPPAFPVEYVFEVSGQTLALLDEPIEAATTGTKVGGPPPRRLDVIPPVALNFASGVSLFAPGSSKSVTLDVTAIRAGTKGTLQLDTPVGWSATPAKQNFKLSTVGEKAQFTFQVTAPSKSTVSTLTAHATVQGARFGSQRIEIRYAHLAPIILQPPARAKLVTLNISTRGKQVGYIPGAGDSIAENLEQMGYSVTRLSGADLTRERLRNLDAVVVGIRAFNTRTDLSAQMTNLFSFVEDGGNVIVQYNRPEGIKVPKIAPYDLRLSNERVCEELAPITILAPDHPVLNSPNKIVQTDFDGWVQERGSYFPNQWDAHFTPILACSDTGEAPKQGGLLIAHHGKGNFIYTGFTWFRQLPAGVPGAFRLFANLVSLGK